MGFFKQALKTEDVKSASPGTGYAKRHLSFWRTFGSDSGNERKQVDKHSRPKHGLKVDDKTVSLWDQAYDRLAKDNSTIIEKYKKLLSAQLLGIGT